MVGHGGDLPGRAARGKHQEIGDVGFSGEIDDDDVFTLVVIQRLFDQRAQRRGGVGIGPFAFGYGNTSRVSGWHHPRANVASGAWFPKDAGRGSRLLIWG